MIYRILYNPLAGNHAAGQAESIRLPLRDGDSACSQDITAITDYPALLLGVNIGGTGTLIASLASLITFREYVAHNPHKAGYYLLMFTLFNVGFVAALTAVAYFVL